MIYTIDEIKNITTPILKRYGISKAYLFGSYARNQATDDSDIDIIIDKGQLKGLFALSGLMLDLSESLNKKIDLITENSLKCNFDRKSQIELKNNIEQERVLFYG